MEATSKTDVSGGRRNLTYIGGGKTRESPLSISGRARRFEVLMGVIRRKQELPLVNDVAGIPKRFWFRYNTGIYQYAWNRMKARPMRQMFASLVFFAVIRLVQK